MFGVLGLTMLPFIGPIIAVVLGVSARKRIVASAGRADGKGLADAGLALGIAGLLITIYFAYMIYTRLIDPGLDIR